MRKHRFARSLRRNPCYYSAFWRMRCAVLCRQENGSSPASLKDFLEVKDWFYNTRASSVFSFESVCAVLDLDPDALRRRLHPWNRVIFRYNTSATGGA